MEKDEKNVLLQNLERLHTTPAGAVRICRNLSLEEKDAAAWCKARISSAAAMCARRGKNWYVTVQDCVITVNAGSCTIITAHKKRAVGGAAKKRGEG